MELGETAAVFVSQIRVPDAYDMLQRHLPRKETIEPTEGKLHKLESLFLQVFVEFR